VKPTTRQDLSSNFFAGLLDGGASIDPMLPLDIQGSTVTSPGQESQSTPGNEPQACLQPVSCEAPTTNLTDVMDNAAQTAGLEVVIEEQRGQLEELRQAISRSDQRCAYYREKAATFRALYSQQRGLAEQIMASLVHLRQNPR
jgi:hypothetical protein